MSYRHVLVDYDGGPRADEALRAAAELARRQETRLSVAAVVELERPCRGCGMWTSIWNDVLIDQARADLDHARQVRDTTAELMLLVGKHDATLLDEARDLGCDAIMLPPRPHRRLARMLSRDRAPALRRRTSCDVLQPVA